MTTKSESNLTARNGSASDVKQSEWSTTPPSVYAVMDALYSHKSTAIYIPSSDVWPGPDVTTFSFNLPFYGRIRIVKDRAGLIASSFILFYWIYGNFIAWVIIFLPRIMENQESYFLMTFYAIISGLCLSSFLRVSTTNPGSINSSYESQADWTLCGKCNKMRPPRAHHCRRCGQCVRKMDHHCPWVNNCVGEENQYMFMLLVAYAYLLSLVTLVLITVSLFFQPTCIKCDKSYFPYTYERMFLWIGLVMATLMSIGGFSLYVTQHISILFETPSMEFSRIQQEMIMLRKMPANMPTQTKSMCTIYKQVFGDSNPIFWLLPCRRRHVKSNCLHV